MRMSICRQPEKKGSEGKRGQDRRGKGSNHASLRSDKIKQEKKLHITLGP